MRDEGRAVRSGRRQGARAQGGDEKKKRSAHAVLGLTTPRPPAKSAHAQTHTRTRVRPSTARSAGPTTTASAGSRAAATRALGAKALGWKRSADDELDWPAGAGGRAGA